MGMSTHIVGIRPPDEQWQRMKDAYDACTTAGVAVPSEVEAFFDGGAPDPAGIVLDVDNAVAEWSDSSREGWDVTIANLPPQVTVVRFYHGY